MLPPGHAAVGYLALSTVRRTYHDDVPSDSSIPWLLLGTQLPDLIDKPLAWWVGVLPSSRSLGHSVLVAIPLVVFVYLRLGGARSSGSEGFAVGYGSHLLSDSIPALAGGGDRVTFLIWPILAPPQYHFRPALWPPTVYADPVSITLGLAVGVLWIADGTPGLAYIRALRDRLIGT